MQSILEVFHQINTDVSTVILLRLGKISNQCQPIFVLRYQTNTMFSCNLLKNKSKLRQSENFKHVSYFNLLGLHWMVINNIIVQISVILDIWKPNAFLNLSSLFLNETDVINEFNMITHKSNTRPKHDSDLFPTLWKLSYITPNSKGCDVTYYYIELSFHRGLVNKFKGASLLSMNFNPMSDWCTVNKLTSVKLFLFTDIFAVHGELILTRFLFMRRLKIERKIYTLKKKTNSKKFKVHEFMQMNVYILSWFKSSEVDDDDR
ncbi:hypothetical protein AGLY_006525 [Aphis glycines]|uniref:Uncharacterized protein n=1 Tax=Aphis glycines TaxID=307491 RepID=A0A6G0TRV3_APHGL|nr:hypothetical protein AGLY_006525 [Aphis glycines]